MVVVDFENERMQNVFGIVEGNDRILALARDLMTEHGLINRIQAIRLRCRARVLSDGLVNARRNSDQLIHASVCFRIIRINSNKNIVAVVDENLFGILRHAINDAAFHPCWDVNGNQLLRLIFQFVESDRNTFLFTPQIAQELQIKKDVIDPENQETNGGRVGENDKNRMKSVHEIYQRSERAAVMRKSEYVLAVSPRVFA